MANGFSQDYLVKKTGDSIKVKIVGIGLEEVKYKEYKNLSGITYGILKSEVLRIRYENGRVESFSDEEIANNMSPEEKCRCGKSDAAKYHGKKGTHFVYGVLFGPFPLVITALTKQTPKRGRHTFIMSEHKALFKDPYYLSCYRKKAKSDLIGMELSGFATLYLIEFIILNYI